MGLSITGMMLAGLRTVALVAGREAGCLASPWLQQHRVPVVVTMSVRTVRTHPFRDPESGRQLLQTTLTEADSTYQDAD